MVALAFVLPLALLVRDLAEDRATGQANLEAQSLVAALGAVDAVTTREQIVDAVRQRTPRQVALFTADGHQYGEATAVDTAVRRALDGRAFTERYRGGREILLPGIGSDRQVFVVRIR